MTPLGRVSALCTVKMPGVPLVAGMGASAAGIRSCSEVCGGGSGVLSPLAPSGAEARDCWTVAGGEGTGEAWAEVPCICKARTMSVEQANILSAPESNNDRDQRCTPSALLGAARDAGRFLLRYQ